MNYDEIYNLALSRLKLGQLQQSRGDHAGAEEKFKYFLNSPLAKHPSMPTDVLADIKAQLAYALLSQKKFEEAEKMYLEVIKMFSDVGDKRSAAVNRASLGYLLKQQHRYEEAKAAFRTSCADYEAIDDKRELGLALANIADILRDQKEYTEAQECYIRSLEIARALGFKSEVAEIHAKLRAMSVEQNRK